MGGLNEWKKRSVPLKDERPDALKKTVTRQIASAAGTEYFQNRDPIYHITEDFQKTFDLMGTAKARERSAVLFQTSMESNVPGLTGIDPEQKEEQKPPDASGLSTGSKRAMGRFSEQTGMDQVVEPSAYPGDQMFLTRFSEMAFNRGTMAGAVLRGTGKMMLFSCLKRTIGQSQPMNFRQRKLFESSSQRRNVSGKPPDQVLFNRGQVDGAVGLVVDVLRDARRTVESMAELASGNNMLAEGSGAETLQKIYPFLSDTRERDLLQTYRAELNHPRDVQSKEILQHAIIKTQALLDKKQQMKQRFIVALRSISDSATAALSTFTQPGYTDEIFGALNDELAIPEPPPEDNNVNDEQEHTKEES